MTTLSIGFDVPFDEAIEAAITRGVVPPAEYYGELQGVARQLAFSIQGITAIDQIRAVRGSLAKAMDSGLSFHEWRRKVAVVDLGLPDHRIENIWRTNLQGNYLRGQWRRYVENKDDRPYLMYDAINDSRTRPSHLAHDGTIRAVDDPFWHTHSPPLGYRCRCSLVSLTAAQARSRSGADRGLNKIPRTPDGMPAGADLGFAFNPAEDILTAISRIIEEKAAGLPPAIKKAAGKFSPSEPDRAFSPMLSTGFDARTLADDLMRGAGKRGEDVTAAMNKAGVKSMFLSQEESLLGSKESLAVADKVAKFTGKEPNRALVDLIGNQAKTIGWTTPHEATYGFASEDLGYVVVRSNRGADFTAKFEDIAGRIEGMIRGKGGNPFAFSELGEGHDHSVVWLHEVGHVLYKAAGKPKPVDAMSITRYGYMNDDEWHAEHFVAWFFAREALAESMPEVAAHFDKLIDGLIR